MAENLLKYTCSMTKLARHMFYCGCTEAPVGPRANGRAVLDMLH